MYYSFVYTVQMQEKKNQRAHPLPQPEAQTLCYNTKEQIPLVGESSRN